MNYADRESLLDLCRRHDLLVDRVRNLEQWTTDHPHIETAPLDHDHPNLAARLDSITQSDLPRLQDAHVNLTQRIENLEPTVAGLTRHVGMLHDLLTKAVDAWINNQPTEGS